MKSKIKKLGNKGFSITEALVVIVVIAIFTIISFPFYQDIRKSLALDRAGIKLVQDIRAAQEMAVSSREIGSVTPRGYGVYFLNSNSYIIFADINGNREYDVGGDSIVETVLIESDIFIDNFASYSGLSIVYIAPDPVVSFRRGGSNLVTNTISINLTNSSKIKTIEINRAGLVGID